MSERYSRLFTLPENLYAQGSPVVIAAGALLKDNQTGKVIAQLKLRSISSKSIRAVKVKLDLFDTAGNPLEETVVHDYLDLNIPRDKDFAQKNPVQITNNKARSYKASVKEVVYTDGSVWTSDNENWEPLSKPIHLSFTDPELLKQYQIQFGRNSIYEPKVEKDLWHCTCGSLNRKDEMCHCCHNPLLALQTVDIAKLKVDKDARLAEQVRVTKQEAEEKAAREVAEQAAKKKAAKKLKIAIAAVCAVIAIVLIVTKVVIPNGKYNDAVALMNAGQYEEAIAAFEAMDGYRDSFMQIENCETAILDKKYNEAISMMEAGQYEAAIAGFEAIDGYKDSVTQIENCNAAIMDAKYNDAVAMMETDVVQAYEALIALNGHKDSRQKARGLCNQHKSELLKNANVGDYLFFGSYEQDNVNSNGKENIVWLVLDKVDNKILVISKYGLDCCPYNDAFAKTSWKSCELRHWLNNDFIDKAFNTYEQGMIVETTVNADGNPMHDTPQGFDTQDKIFLLSVNEAEKYFTDNDARICFPTDYAHAISESNQRWAPDKTDMGWWLRTNGEESLGVWEITLVWGSGEINYDGDSSYVYDYSVRPAMWISLETQTTN